MNSGAYVECCRIHSAVPLLKAGPTLQVTSSQTPQSADNALASNLPNRREGVEFMTAEVIIKGSRAGMSPGLRQPPEPEQGELRRTPVEIEGPYFRLGA